MFLGAGFAALFLATVGQWLRRVLPPDLAAPAATSLLAGAAAVFLALPALHWLHERRRVLAVELDPLGLLLRTRRGPVRVPLDRLARVRAAAEPAFLQGRFHVRHGPDLPGFHAALRFKLHDGSTWEFVAARSEDAAGALAWLDVLGAGGKVTWPPSALAAERKADRALLAAILLLGGAIASVGGALAIQLAGTLLFAVPEALLWSLGAQGLGCMLYAGSYHAQLRAARCWLAGRGMRAGPPVAAAAQAPEAAPRASR